MRKIFAAASVVLALVAAPALAQQKSTANDRAMTQAVAFQKNFVDSYNKRDSEAIAALFTANAVFVDPAGTVRQGHAAIETMNANTVKAWGDFKFASVVKEAHAVGTGYWFTFESTADIKGANGPMTLHVHGLNVLVPEGKSWKIAVTSLGVDAPPPGAPTAR